MTMAVIESPGIPKREPDQSPARQELFAVPESTIAQSIPPHIFRVLWNSFRYSVSNPSSDVSACARKDAMKFPIVRTEAH